MSLKNVLYFGERNELIDYRTLFIIHSWLLIKVLSFCTIKLNQSPSCGDSMESPRTFSFPRLSENLIDGFMHNVITKCNPAHMVWQIRLKMNRYKKKTPNEKIEQKCHATQWCMITRRTCLLMSILLCGYDEFQLYAHGLIGDCSEMRTKRSG